VRGRERLEVWVREGEGAVAEGDAGGWAVRAERWWRVRRARRLRRIRKAQRGIGEDGDGLGLGCGFGIASSEVGTGV